MDDIKYVKMDWDDIPTETEISDMHDNGEMAIVVLDSEQFKHLSNKKVKMEIVEYGIFK
jgi:hypothetical protein